MMAGIRAFNRLYQRGEGIEWSDEKSTGFKPRPEFEISHLVAV